MDLKDEHYRTKTDHIYRKEPVIFEAKSQLKSNKLIKVKILKSAKEDADRKEIAENFVKSAGAKLMELRGNTFIISK